MSTTLVSVNREDADGGELRRLYTQASLRAAVRTTGGLGTRSLGGVRRPVLEALRPARFTCCPAENTLRGLAAGISAQFRDDVITKIRAGGHVKHEGNGRQGPGLGHRRHAVHTNSLTCAGRRSV